jgi:seryl-tRNA synthetase
VSGGGWLLDTPATGVYLYPDQCEAVVHGLSRALTALLGGHVKQSLRAPPVIARSVIERVEYDKSFPHLLGTVTTRGIASDLVLLPAGCYCVYPLYADARLSAVDEVSVEATCFRQEATAEAGRLRSFRMREFVRLDNDDGCRSWRDRCLDVVCDWLGELGLATETAVASDPFFGSGNRLMRGLQMDQKLKFEVLTTVAPGLTQAVASGNCHKDQFGKLFSITDATGDAAHTACVAFGYERLVLALTHQHGDDLRRWPEPVRKALSLAAAL